MQTLGLEDAAGAEWREVLILTLHQAALARTVAADTTLALHDVCACRMAQSLLR